MNLLNGSVLPLREEDRVSSEGYESLHCFILDRRAWVLPHGMVDYWNIVLNRPIFCHRIDSGPARYQDIARATAVKQDSQATGKKEGVEQVGIAGGEQLHPARGEILLRCFEYRLLPAVITASPGFPSVTKCVPWADGDLATEQALCETRQALELGPQAGFDNIEATACPSLCRS